MPWPLCSVIKKRGAPVNRRLRHEAEWMDFRPEGPENGARSRSGLDAVAEGAQRDNIDSAAPTQPPPFGGGFFIPPALQKCREYGTLYPINS